MSTYVLIHGAWQGGWCWKFVAKSLIFKGHEVHAPTLPGMGELAKLLTRQITLDTHVDAIVDFLEFNDLEQVVLVGHSYSGLVITGVADRVLNRRRISRLVYLDALVPQSGDGWSSFHQPEQVAAKNADAAVAGRGLFLSPPDAGIWAIDDKDQLAWVNARLTAHPYGTYQFPLHLPELAQGRGAAMYPRTYIDCVAPVYSQFSGLKARLRMDAAWEYLEIAGGHNVMITDPELLADALTNV